MAIANAINVDTPGKVLIADDDAPTRILLKAAISQWGYQVVEAKDGLEAWQVMIQPNSPRLMIIDWLMPGLDGIALCERAKKELNYRPYIILLTQVTGTTNIVKGLEAGADEFLSKPFNMAELRSRLSIGQRIIGYDLALNERNSQLQDYVSKMHALTKSALEVTNKIHEMTQDPNFCNAANIAPNQKQKLDELKNNMQATIDAIKQLEQSHSEKA